MRELYGEKILDNLHEIEGDGIQTYNNVKPKAFEDTNA